MKDYFSLREKDKIEFTSKLLGIEKTEIEKRLDLLYDLIDPASISWNTDIDLCEMLLDSLIFKETDEFDTFYQAYDFYYYEEKNKKEKNNS